MSKQAQISKNEIADGWSPESADFINKVEISSYKAFTKETL